MSLQLEGLNFSYGNKPVLFNISTPIFNPGELIVLLGPNAAGKSTLFKNMAGVLDGRASKFFLNGENMQAQPNVQRQKKICYMPQNFSSNAALSVFEVILLACKQLEGWRVSQEELGLVDRVLKKVGIEHLAQRHIGELSGGQQQLVSLCQSLVRNVDVLLLDEPTSALDLNRQLQALSLIKKETSERGLITVIALHDLNMAARFADQVCIMKEGRLMAAGNVEEVFHSGAIQETYQIEMELLTCNRGSLMVSPWL